MHSPASNGVPSGSGTQQWPASQQHPFMPQGGPNAQLPNGMSGANNMIMPPMPMNMFPGFLHQVASQTKRPIGSIDDDQVLVRAFRERNGRNYRQVLESLDMVRYQPKFMLFQHSRYCQKNGYSAQQWKACSYIPWHSTQHANGYVCRITILTIHLESDG
jgi:hypothetical protein